MNLLKPLISIDEIKKITGLTSNPEAEKLANFMYYQLVAGGSPINLCEKEIEEVIEPVNISNSSHNWVYHQSKPISIYKSTYPITTIDTIEAYPDKTIIYKDGEEVSFKMFTKRLEINCNSNILLTYSSHIPAEYKDKILNAILFIYLDIGVNFDEKTTLGEGDLISFSADDTRYLYDKNTVLSKNNYIFKNPTLKNLLKDLCPLL
jgi:hypothetical protein